MKNFPTWFQLLYYQKHDLGHDGLTLPFLVAGVRILAGLPLTTAVAIEELRQFLLEVIDTTPTAFKTRLFECPKLGQPVLSFIDAAYSATDGNGLHSERQNRDTIFAAYEYVRDGMNLDAITNSLWARLHEPLSKRLFNFDGRNYVPFSNANRAFVEKAHQSEERRRRSY